MKKQAFLIGEKVYLRAFQPGDEEMIARIENHPDPRLTLFYAFPTTTEYQFEKTQKQLADKNNIVFTICCIENDQPIGQTALLRIDWVGRMAVFYIGIADKENWSKGYGSETLAVVLEYAFNTVNINRVQLVVAVENTAAVKVYQKSGFLIEGTLREAMYHQGRYCDFYIMGILKSDWDKKNNL